MKTEVAGDLCGCVVQELSIKITMDLVTLLRSAPTLLEKIVKMRLGDGINSRNYNIGNLRLVSKEASEVALNAVKHYTLSLTGSSGLAGQRDTNVSGARLLQHTKLQRLDVNVSLNGEFSLFCGNPRYVSSQGGQRRHLGAS